MNKGTAIGLGILGVGAAAALAYYLYNKNNTVQVTETVTTSTSPGLLPSSTSTTPAASSTTAPAVPQTMWKDKDGNIFKLITSQEDKYGYLLQVNGSGNSKAVTVELGPDGYVYTTNKVGEKWMYKGKWNRLSGLSGVLGSLPAYALT